MDGREFRFQQGARVRLKDGVDPSFYDGMSTYGNEGVIKDRRLDDRFGLPQVYIVWDRNHWTYNGAPNRWTFEEHFDLVKEVEEPMSSKEEKFAQLMAQMQELIAQDDPDEQASEEVEAPVEDVTDELQSNTAEATPEEFARAIKLAADKLPETEAFMVIGVERHTHPRAAKGMLVPWAIMLGKNAEASLVGQAALGKLAAEEHQALVLQAVALLAQDDA